MTLPVTFAGVRPPPARPAGRRYDRLWPVNTRVPSVLGRGAGAYGRTRGGSGAGPLDAWRSSLPMALASYRGRPFRRRWSRSCRAPPGPDWVGPVGLPLRPWALCRSVGIVAWGLPLELVLLGIPLVRGKESPATPRAAALGGLLDRRRHRGARPGGEPGSHGVRRPSSKRPRGRALRRASRARCFSTAGSFLVGFACLGLILIEPAAAFSFIALARLAARVAGGDRGVDRRARPERCGTPGDRARALEREREDFLQRIASEPHIDTSPKDEAIVAALPLSDFDEGIAGTLARRGRHRLRTEALPRPLARSSQLRAGPGACAFVPGSPTRRSRPRPSPAPSTFDRNHDRPRGRTRLVQAQAPTQGSHDRRHLVCPRQGAAGACRTARVLAALRASRAWTFCNAEKVEPKTLPSTATSCSANAQTLVETLEHYGVQGEVSRTSLPGPTVTTYEVSPAAGTKVSKVAGLADDLALALARKVRIVAPIPWQEPDWLRASELTSV